MALLLSTMNSTLKSGLVPLTEKLDDKNFSTWKYQAWLTIQTLELEHHLDPSKTPSPTAADLAASTPKNASLEGEGVTPPPKADAEKKIPESETYRQWRQNDLALQTWLAASISKPYQNKILQCKNFYEAWNTIQTIVTATSKTRI
ncbi:hypothetical protein PIB30_046211 [Stylosanthes scabra]|uniref:Retrotransposon Copia-like N-terminal domain-containing protein n=1 Tax=Stylosanthes scabra TaxID=79078 RepID=A0ABU6QGZ2_9FABA|nr:hypothetical protein [Stylosanthes scabra]